MYFPENQTLSPEQHANRSHQIAEYTMPAVHAGLLVLWRPFPGSRSPEFGYVMPGEKQSNHKAKILVPSRGWEIDSCPHITHPDMQYPQLIDRTVGCWDYTDEHKHMKHWLSEVERRLAAIERALDESPNGSSKSSTAKK